MPPKILCALKIS